MRDVEFVLSIVLLCYCSWTEIAHAGCQRKATESVHRRRTPIIDNCPVKCRCVFVSPGNKTYVKVNCARRGFREIPKILPENTSQLILSENNIARIRSNNLQGCAKLTVLNISYNQLLHQGIENGSFRNVPELQRLYLDNNRIDTETMPADMLAGNKNLRVLIIQNNMWSKSQKYNDAFFSNLASLKTLSLDAFGNISFSAGFSKLTNLQTLIIDDGLKVITDDTFAAFANCPLKSLRIVVRDQLESLAEFGLKHLRQLENLTFTDSQRIGFDEISKAWRGLSLTNITNLVLTRVDWKQQQNITTSFFRYLNHTNITQLKLPYNNIFRFEPHLSDNLPKLEKLDLSNNRLWEGTNISLLISDLRQLKTLQYLNLNYQSVDTEQSDEQQDIYTFESSAIHQTQSHDCNISMIYTTSKISVALDVRDTWCIPMPPGLRKIHMRRSFNGRILEFTKPVVIIGGDNIVMIDLAENGIRKITKPVVFSQNSTNLEIDLSSNNMSCLSPEVFRVSGHAIAKLQLSDNNLGQQLSSDTEGDTFRYLINLKQLNLSKNDIESLPEKVFSYLLSIKKLDLRGNKLKDVTFDPTYFKTLPVVDLSSNQIRSVNDSSLTKLSSMMTRDGKSLTLNLRKNPHSCSCQHVSFVRWMHVHKTSLKFFSRSYTCSLSETVMTRVKLRLVDPDNLSYNCYKIMALTVTGILFGMLILLVSMSICIFRYRWEIRYFCLKFTNRGRQYQMIIDQMRHYDYDAFVSYDSGDRLWVNEQLLPHLEDEDILDGHSSADMPQSRSIRLCVHERDFPPGEDILGNIWTKMERSRKTILVLSKSFTKSNYCNYEVQLARMNSVEQARNLIIPVLLEPVDVQDMSECLRWIVKKLTYIEWPEHLSDREEFWQKLRSTILAYDVELYRCSEHHHV